MTTEWVLEFSEGSASGSVFNGALQHYQESRAQLDFTISGVRQLSRIWSRRAHLAWPSQALLAWKTFTSKQVRTFSFWRPSRSVWDHPIPSGCLQSVCSFKPCLSLCPFPNDAKVQKRMLSFCFVFSRPVSWVLSTKSWMIICLK